MHESVILRPRMVLTSDIMFMLQCFMDQMGLETVCKRITSPWMEQPQSPTAKLHILNPAVSRPKTLQTGNTQGYKTIESRLGPSASFPAEWTLWWSRSLPYPTRHTPPMLSPLPSLQQPPIRVISTICVCILSINSHSPSRTHQLEVSSQIA